MRADVSDALPGVDIAISLVPPLSAVGLTLESGAVDQALGALLLFATNVAAIIATGVVVLLKGRAEWSTRRDALKSTSRGTPGGLPAPPT